MQLRTAFLGAAFLFASATATAQSSVSGGDESVGATQRSDWSDNPRLELLGLLGLGGLFGLMRRREPNIHIDARGEKPPSDR
jgi:MYXO-CTERM domain-containing protein